MAYYIKPCDGLITSFMDRGRNHPLAGVIRPHQGVDIGSAEDNRIWAAASGTVYQIGYSPKSAGNYVLIKHPNGHTTSYSHLSRIDVKQGQTVSQGERIGMKGATGLATGVHLHFEIAKGNWTSTYANKLNPLLYFVDPLTKEMQGWLKELGYDVEPDGYYGEKMISAVALYQKRNNMHVDGYAGRGTYAALKAESAKQVASDKPIEKEGGNRVWIEFSSPTLEKEFITFLESKGQQEIAVKQGVDQGFSKSWETNEKATPGDKAALGLLGMIREKR
ncbi:peptidoglycan DD-metalloendopeptidase family protein [Sporosarcina sp. P17b]|uniref:peptidoglycan DD-metalloendopeptidase family protein n=1 Tax=Sporosarcina sp. P17b TaxID=2048260 RepID=UPI000C16A445|nr:peptidoglycan DD-metalloendopeptidase family protein [Sporosarcina sp. P17b]PIC71017.1 hypothetical protein CSV76_16750 [Sporosarcina sp. P17b]